MVDVTKHASTVITKGLNSDPLVWDLDSCDSATVIDASEGESGSNDECEIQEEDKEHPTIEPKYHPMQIVGDNSDLHINLSISLWTKETNHYTAFILLQQRNG